MRIGCSCPGYNQHWRWSTKYERARIPSPPVSGACSTTRSSSSHPQSSNLGSDVVCVPIDGRKTGAHETDRQNLHSLVDVPTMLVEYWFRRVCPMRSVFDSEVNYNRQIASSTWSSSSTVFLTMQAMSAACLVDEMPHLSETLLSLKTQASSAITKAIFIVQSLHAASVTADLVFAALSYGTSLHWTEPALREQPWLKSVRELLSLWKTQRLSSRDVFLHAYFCQALTYWEMLLSVTGGGAIPAEVEKKRQHYKGNLCRAMHLPETASEAATAQKAIYPDHSHSIYGTRPNSWCGVSSEVIHIFGQVMALCLGTYRRQNDAGPPSLMGSVDGLCDISVARDLQKELQSMDFVSLCSKEESEGFIVQTRDDRTPLSHLLLTAEAYRLASLLQLRLAFRHLEEAPCRPDEASAQEREPRTRDEKSFTDTTCVHQLVTLAVQLVHTLEQIPVESGSKSSHSMLFLSAAAGLRFDRNSALEADMLSCGCTGSWTSNDISSIFTDTSPSATFPWSHLSSSSLSTSEPDLPAQYANRVSDEVSRARGVVWTRLTGLRRALPQGTSDDTLQLVHALWSEYDRQESASSDVYWMDVMTRTGSTLMLW